MFNFFMRKFFFETYAKYRQTPQVKFVSKLISLSTLIISQ